MFLGKVYVLCTESTPYTIDRLEQPIVIRLHFLEDLIDLIPCVTSIHDVLMPYKSSDAGLV